MAACYSPDEDHPGEVVLPFDLDTGKIIDEVWARWLAWDPVRMAAKSAEALRSMRHIYLDAGRVRRVLTSTSAPRLSPRSCPPIGVEHTLELFEGTHGGLHTAIQER